MPSTGPTDRYVSRQRLRAMLDYEYELLLERLKEKRGAKTAFFVFCQHRCNQTRRRQWLAWNPFQAEPGAEASEILIHVRMLDKENVRQQEALGIIGVNLLHGTFYHHDEPRALIRSLLDSLTWERVEVDMVRFSGPAFAGLDNRLMALHLVKEGLTEAAMFTAEGETVQWAEVLYKKAGAGSARQFQAGHEGHARRSGARSRMLYSRAGIERRNAGCPHGDDLAAPDDWRRHRRNGFPAPRPHAGRAWQKQC